MVGAGFSALVVTAAIAGLTSPPDENSAIAVPAASLSTSPTWQHGSRPPVTSSRAERVAAKTRGNRELARAKLIAAKQAAKRAKSLGRDQGDSRPAGQDQSRAGGRGEESGRGEGCS